MNELKSHFRFQIQDMLLYKEAQGYCASTHKYHLYSFDQYCCSNFPLETSLTQELVLSWARRRESESPNGFKRRIVTIREFARYLQSVGLKAYMLPPKMTGPSQRYIPHIFTDTELSVFFYGADHFEESVRDPLNHLVVPVMFRLIYCCGLRPTEGRAADYDQRMCSTNTIESYREALNLLLVFLQTQRKLNLFNITFETLNSATIFDFLTWLEHERGCGVSTRNQRLACIRVFFNYAVRMDISLIAYEKTALHCSNYLKLFHPTPQDLSQYLFYTTRHGEKQQMSDDNVARFLRTYGIAAREKCSEIPDNIHPHLFRHTRAMHLYRGGMPPALLEEWLCHVQMETTMIYAHVNTEMKRLAI